MDEPQDPWELVTEPGCEHDSIAVEPGRTEDVACIGYCDNCGVRLEMGFSWTDHKLEVDFNHWAAQKAGGS